MFKGRGSAPEPPVSSRQQPGVLSSAVGRVVCVGHLDRNSSGITGYTLDVNKHPIFSNVYRPT